MNEIPPAEAFEPQPGDPIGPGRRRPRVQIAVTLILVASLVVLAAIEGGGYVFRADRVDTTPTPPPAPARIAAVDSAGALTTIEGFGKSVVTYSVPGVAFQFPAWSPDGTRIAAIGTGPNSTGVYVFAARAAADAAIDPIIVYESADRPPFYLFWTPDGRQLTFLTTEPSALALRIAPAEASATDSIVRSGAPMYWDFVDPGRLLVHVGTSGPDAFLAEVTVDGAALEGTSASPGVFRAPAVSGDGRYRAYVTDGVNGTGEVVLEARDGGAGNRVRVFAPAVALFNPGGDQLAFVAPNEPATDLLFPIGPLRLMDPASADTRTLFGGIVVAFFWSPTGKEIAILRLEDPANPTPGTQTETGQGHGTTLARANTSAQEAVAGVSLRLGFVDVATGTIHSDRAVQLSEGFVNGVLPYYDQYAHSHRIWSPDGSAIVLPLVGEGDVTHLVVIPADGSGTQTVATGEMGFWSP